MKKLIITGLTSIAMSFGVSAAPVNPQVCATLRNDVGVIATLRDDGVSHADIITLIYNSYPNNENMRKVLSALAITLYSDPTAGADQASQFVYDVCMKRSVSF